MALRNQNPIAVTGLILVIVIAFISIIKTASPKRYTRAISDWTCEECNHKFLAQARKEPRACPRCRKEALRTYYFYCSVHDHVFEGYRFKPNPEAPPRKEMRPDYDMERLFRVPGGEWTTKHPTVITCPQGNSDRATIVYCPPTSDKRKPK